MAYYELEAPIAARAAESARAAFIRRTYAHLAAAILAFAAIEFLIFSLIPHDRIREAVITVWARSPWAALLVVGAFIGVGWLARVWARSETSPGVQYMGLALYVIFEAFIFVPLIFIAVVILNQPSIIATAGVLTLSLFGGLTLAVFVTRKDFSFLAPILSIASLVTLGFIVAAILFGFTLGLFFSFAMVALASAFILYDTSNVIHHFRTDQHVAASLELFASVAFLFYYILWILIQVSGGSRD